LRRRGRDQQRRDGSGRLEGLEFHSLRQAKAFKTSRPPEAGKPT